MGIRLLFRSIIAIAVCGVLSAGHIAGTAASGDSAGDDVLSVIRKIPCKYAQVFDIKMIDTEAPWVVYIKDYHCQYEIQRNIYNTIYYLTQTIGQSEKLPICIEGAVGPVDTTFVASIPDSEIRNDVSDYFMKTGKISGAEFFCITRGPQQPLIGVDDESLYNESFDLYTAVFAGYNRFAEQVQYIDSLCDAAAKTTLSETGRDLAACAVMLHNDFSFESFLDATEPYRAKLSDEQIPESLRRYADSLRRQQSLSPQRLNDLQQELVAVLTETLDSAQRSELMKSYIGYQLGEIAQQVFLTKILTQARQAGCLTSRYDDLSTALEVFTTFDSLDERELFADCNTLYTTLQQQFCTPEEQDYMQARTYWETVKKILALELTRERFEQFDQAQLDYLYTSIDEYRTNLKTQVPLYRGFDFFSHLPQLIDQASAFYANSVKRDNVLFGNTLTAMKDNTSHIAIIVAGGFHARGLQSVLDSQKVNYAVINPVLETDEHTNYYRSIMMNRPVTIDQFFPTEMTLAQNRLSPRVRLANALANPQLMQQLMKETVLLAKVLSIARSPELFDQLRDLGQDMPSSFRNQASEAVRAFGQKWLAVYKDLKKQKNENVSYKELEKITHLLKKMVLVEVADMRDNLSTLGIHIVESTGQRTRIQVSFTEYMRLTKTFNANRTPGVAIQPFAEREQIGDFEFVFHRMEDAQLYERPEISDAHRSESDQATFWRKSQTISGLVEQIDELKKASVADPFNNKLRAQLIKKLQRLSKFLRYAAHQEMKSGNMAQSYLLRANASLYNGNYDRAVKYFDLYVQELPEDQRNRAGQFFKRNTIIRGQKISLAIQDESGRPYVDRYGREIASHMFDDTLVYGSEPSKIVQNRLIELANRYDSENKKYLASVVRAAAYRLTDENRNYHHNEIDVARFTREGRRAYRMSFLGEGSNSYGAISDEVTDQFVLGQVLPGVSYLYDPEITRKLEESGDLYYPSHDAGLVKTVLPADSIQAVLVNKMHRVNALEVLREHPGRQVPLLDTLGNVLWLNAPVDAVVEQYEQSFIEFENSEKTKENATYMKRIKNPSKLVALGDLHSDVYAARQTLRAAGVIDDSDKWIAKPGSIVVFNGDIIDRGTGADQKEMIDFAMNLQVQAREHESELVVIMGNHETMFLSGEWYSESEKTMQEFLNLTGFTIEQSLELRDALKTNDLFKIGMLRKENPEGMKYIDFLWHLPIVAHIGGHIFVHGGPTAAFNDLLESTMRAFPDWSVEQCVDHIFQQEIAKRGFNSPLFKANTESILTAAPQMTMPDFISNQSVVDRFLSFFDGAGFVAVGHNKALGIIGQNDEYPNIHRLGQAKNIIKLDVGVNHNVNAHERRIQGKAYIVDPRQIDFVTSVSETGDQMSLMRKGDNRMNFIRTEAALLYETILAEKSREFLIDAEKPKVGKSKRLDEEYMNFFRIFFMIYAEDPIVLDKSFIDQTWRLLKPEPFYLKNRLTAKNEIPEIDRLLGYYRGYINELREGLIPRDDISLRQFQDYVARRQHSSSANTISTKVVGTDRVIDMENDVQRFYSVMAHSDIQVMPRILVNKLRSRLEQIIEAHRKTVKPAEMSVDPTLQRLTRAKFYMSETDKQLSFKLIDPFNGTPCLFVGEDAAVTGFVLNQTIYLSAPIVQRFLDQFEAGDTSALDKLLALAVHELHEFREDKVVEDQMRRNLHMQAEELERIICGTGETGSKLDDEIDRAINEYNTAMEDVRKVAIKKFLNSFRTYLKQQADMNLYSIIFQKTRLPIEGDVLTNVDLADNMLGMLIDTKPVDTFNALLADIADRTSLFFAVDHSLFSENELLVLVDLITTAADIRITSEPQIGDDGVPYYVIEDPRPAAPVDLRKSVTATMAVDKSL